MYNHLLEKFKKGILSSGELQREVVEIKKIKPEFNAIYSKVLQYESYRLFSNLRSLKRLKKNGRKVGKLRFKGKDWFKTFSYNQSGFKLFNVKGNKGILHLSKIGDIKIRLHRAVESKIKQVTLRNRLGKWYAILIAGRKPVRVHGEKVLGIDLGINKYIVDSDAIITRHPHTFDKYAKKLALALVNLSRKMRGSNNRLKAKLRVLTMHEKIKMCRSDFLHKISAHYVAECKTIVVENLNVISLIRSSRNARNIMDSSWSRFLHMLSYKAESAGCELVKVNPKNTTKMCSK